MSGVNDRLNYAFNLARNVVDYGYQHKDHENLLTRPNTPKRTPAAPIAGGPGGVR